MEKNTQMNAVLNHMRTHGSITSLEAIEKYGATRLSGLIFKLKKKGYCIITEMHPGKNRYGGTCTYAKYILLEPRVGRQ